MRSSLTQWTRSLTGTQNLKLFPYPNQYYLNKYITSCSRPRLQYFTLPLPKFGPYGVHYSPNGRHLCLTGAAGHTAVVEWQSKDLKCEFNVMESVHDMA